MSVSVTWDARVPTTNEMVRMHWRKAAEETAYLRDIFGKIGRRGRQGAGFDRALVVVTHEWSGNRKLPDPSAVSLATKAGLDGLVDAGLLPDDNGDHVAGELYLPARRSTRNALTISLIDQIPEWLETL